MWADFSRIFISRCFTSHIDSAKTLLQSSFEPKPFLFANTFWKLHNYWWNRNDAKNTKIFALCTFGWNSEASSWRSWNMQKKTCWKFVWKFYAGTNMQLKYRMDVGVILKPSKIKIYVTRLIFYSKGLRTLGSTVSCLNEIFQTAAI